MPVIASPAACFRNNPNSVTVPLSEPEVLKSQLSGPEVLNYSSMRVALGQINPTVGDLPGNAALCERQAREAAARGAELIVFPELSLTGYPPRDLVEKASFIDESEATLEKLALATRDLPVAIIAGYVGRSHESTGKRATNSAAVVHTGRIVLRQTKILLPAYDVFDESRNFVPGESQCIWTTKTGTAQTATTSAGGAREATTEKIALTICEDAWNDKQFWTHRLYPRDPVDELMQRGASMLVSINASPYHIGKRDFRMPDVPRPRAPSQSARHRGEPGRRQRSACLRWIELRHGCRGQRDRVRRFVPGRSDRRRYHHRSRRSACRLSG